MPNARNKAILLPSVIQPKGASGRRELVRANTPAQRAALRLDPNALPTPEVAIMRPHPLLATLVVLIVLLGLTHGAAAQQGDTET